MHKISEMLFAIIPTVKVSHVTCLSPLFSQMNQLVWTAPKKLGHFRLVGKRIGIAPVDS